jgi:hypothetical protein
MLSSVGRAAPLHGVGREFEPLSIHQSFFLFVPPEGLGSFGGIFFGGETLTNAEPKGNLPYNQRKKVDCVRVAFPRFVFPF